MIPLTLTFVALSFTFISSLLTYGVNASPCVAMDSDSNLLVFGLNGKDFNAGTQDTWTGSECAWPLNEDVWID